MWVCVWEVQDEYSFQEKIRWSFDSLVYNFVKYMQSFACFTWQNKVLLKQKKIRLETKLQIRLY